ncbi:MAG: thioredoxin family protein [candidate division FCPU426 bacterium]
MSQEINQDQFEAQVLQSEQPVVLDFFSTECPPCEALAPKFESVAQGFEGHVKFLKIFRQGNRPLAERLNVSSSPTLVFFRGGQEVGQRLTGDIKKSELKAAVEALLEG